MASRARYRKLYRPQHGEPAESEGVSADKVIERLVQETPSKEGELTRDPRFQKIFAA